MWYKLNRPNPTAWARSYVRLPEQFLPTILLLEMWRSRAIMISSKQDRLEEVRISLRAVAWRSLTGALLLTTIALSAWGGVDDDEQIGFLWQPPSNAETAVWKYRIYLSVDGLPFEPVDSTINTYYIVKGDSGSCYRLQVAGVNAYGEEGCPSPESEPIWCLPQEFTPVAFEYATAQAQEGLDHIKLIWETNEYLSPSSFRIQRRNLSSSVECPVEADVISDPANGTERFRYWCIDREVVLGETYRYTIQASDPSGCGLVAVSLCAQVKGPEDYRLFQNYPNPFNAETTISYQNPQAGRVVLTIYNARGQKVRTLLDNVEAPGLHLTTWDGLDGTGVPVASGVYFCHMWSGSFVDVKKLTVLR
jgi:hypothetical protein